MSLQITIDINDLDEKILKNDLLDVEQWVQQMVAGKVDSCWSRFRQEWTQKLLDDPSFNGSIPGNKEEFVDMVLEREDYSNRVQRNQSLPV